MTRRFRKRPVTIEAFKLGSDQAPDWFSSRVDAGTITFPNGLDDAMGADIQTLEGVMHASEGDYVIRGVAGEIYPCKPDIFEATYEELQL